MAFASHHWPTWDTSEIISYLTQQRDLYAPALWPPVTASSSAVASQRRELLAVLDSRRGGSSGDGVAVAVIGE